MIFNDITWYLCERTVLLLFLFSNKKLLKFLIKYVNNKPTEEYYK